MIAQAIAFMNRQPTLQGIPRADANSRRAHEQLLAKAGQGRIDLCFLGDSITRRWGCADPMYSRFLEHWRSQFFGWNAGNFGWGGDGVWNILWRVQNGELDGMRPKVIVLMAGTNDIGYGHDQPGIVERTHEGILAILAECRRRAPEAHLILTSAFPRSDNLDANLKIRELNALLADHGDREDFTWIDLSGRLAGPDGLPRPGMLESDGLHADLPAYRVWAAALEPHLRRELGRRAAVDLAPPPTADPSLDG